MPGKSESGVEACSKNNNLGENLFKKQLDANKCRKNNRVEKSPFLNCDWFREKSLMDIKTIGQILFGNGCLHGIKVASKQL